MNAFNSDDIATSVHICGEKVPLRVDRSGRVRSTQHNLNLILDSDEFQEDFFLSRLDPDGKGDLEYTCNGNFICRGVRFAILSWISTHYDVEFGRRQLKDSIEMQCEHNYGSGYDDYDDWALDRKVAKSMQVGGAV